jgi:hypothetical protein
MTSGVALVGASVIAISPIAPPPADVHLPAPHVSTASVELAAAFDPIAVYNGLITNTLSNIVGLGNEVLSDPAPIIRQIITNSLANAQTIVTALQGTVSATVTAIQNLPPTLQTAANQLLSGNFAGAVDTVSTYLVSSALFGIALPLITAPITVAQNISFNINNVIQNGIVAVLLAGLAPVYPINAAVSAFGALGQDILDSAGGGDIAGVVGDLISAPGVLANAFLNGFPNGISSLISPAGGLLTTAANVGFGTVTNLLQAAKAIAGLLTHPLPPAPIAEVASVSSARQTLVTLDVKTEPGTETSVEDKSGQDGAKAVDESTSSAADNTGKQGADDATAQSKTTADAVNDATKDTTGNTNSATTQDTTGNTTQDSSQASQGESTEAGSSDPAPAPEPKAKPKHRKVGKWGHTKSADNTKSADTKSAEGGSGDSGHGDADK